MSTQCPVLPTQGQIPFHGKRRLGGINCTRWWEKITHQTSKARKRKESHHPIRKAKIKRLNRILWVNEPERTVKKGGAKTACWFQESSNRNEKQTGKFDNHQGLARVKIARVVWTWTRKNKQEFWNWRKQQKTWKEGRRGSRESTDVHQWNCTAHCFIFSQA